MEKLSAFSTHPDPIELPPGFRFHPTDEELITHYLSPKVVNTSFTTKAMGEVDLNKVEPWDLPWKAKMGEKEWYFFCAKDRKYPTGLRTNRATEAGYWKATGKDREIFRANLLVGMKKTLVFYRGRAPRGEKTNWVLHEYRLEGKNSNCNIPKPATNEWVICRIFKKTTGGKKVHISGLVRSADDSQSPDLPPLMDLSPDEDHVTTPAANTQVSKQTYLSNQMENSAHKLLDGFTSSSSNFSPFPFTFPQVSTPNLGFSSQIIPRKESLNNRGLVMMQDQSILRLMIHNNSSNTTGTDTELSQGKSCDEVGYEGYEDQEFPSVSTAQINLDWLWDYLMDC